MNPVCGFPLEILMLNALRASLWWAFFITAIFKQPASRGIKDYEREVLTVNTNKMHGAHII